MANKGKQEEIQPIIIKKVIKKAGGHHGGAWKVAYADFVTAMMAFFLLLWLLNVSTDDALEVISSYFDPSHPKVADTRSGSGGVLGGLTMTKEGSMAQMMQKPVQPENSGYKRDVQDKGEKKNDNETVKKLEEQLRKQENKRFEEAKKNLEEAMKKNPQLQELAKHLQIDITEEGLRIQIIDQEGEPMFALGSAEMLPKMKVLMDQVAEVIKGMPNNISVRGHTDSNQYAPGASYTNWELSSDRANTARRALLDKGVDVGRLHDVMGKADNEPLITDNPQDPRNRRISVILLRESVEEAFQRGAFDDQLTGEEDEVAPTEDQPADEGEETGDESGQQDGEGSSYENLPRMNDKPVGTFQKTPGSVYFP